VTIFGATQKPEALARYAELGVERVLFGLPPAGADQVLPKLDRLVELTGRAGS
jgi:hypothetical protein